MAKMWEGGRDLEGMELAVEYCDRRFLEACDIGRGIWLLRAGGEVMRGGSAGSAALAFAFAEAGEDMAGGDVAGDDPGDMNAVMVLEGVDHASARNCSVPRVG